jgi:hypothetical protein
MGYLVLGYYNFAKLEKHHYYLYISKFVITFFFYPVLAIFYIFIHRGAHCHRICTHMFRMLPSPLADMWASQVRFFLNL